MSNAGIFKYLVDSGMTQAGAAGMMGNMQCESGLQSNKVEDLCLFRLRELGKIYTDATYTAFVDDGTISRSAFLHPLPGKQFGYGLAQWTSPSRKERLYDLCKSRHKSIGDLDTQLEYLITELKTSYRSVWNILIVTNDVKDASDTVLTRFEQPADTGAAVKSQRYNVSEMFYKQFATKDKETMTVDQAINKVLSVAEDELGYLEKASNAELDSKTYNAGSGNYTKYWRDTYPIYQGQPWCADFVSWCLERAFGLELAKKLLKHWPFVYCPTLAGMTTNKTPYRGSIALFYRNGVYAHTGFVKSVSKSAITTIEGNTSGSSGIVPNGGGVFEKTYSLSSLSPNTKYFMPDYSLVATGGNVPTTPVKDKETNYMFETTTVQNGTTGKCALLLQTLLKGKGYNGSDGQPLVLDGEAGPKTIWALKNYQNAHKLDADGICGKKTWKSIIGL